MAVVADEIYLAIYIMILSSGCLYIHVYLLLTCNYATVIPKSETNQTTYSETSDKHGVACLIVWLHTYLLTPTRREEHSLASSDKIGKCLLR